MDWLKTLLLGPCFPLSEYYNNILKLYEDLNKEKDNKKQEPLPEVKNWLAKKAEEKNDANKRLLARVDRIKNEIDKISSSDSLQKKMLKLWFDEKDGCHHFELVYKRAYDLIELRQSIIFNSKRYDLAKLMNYHTVFSDLYKESNNKSESLDTLPKIAIVGQFSCGKSQFINSLLGEEIQQTGPNPVTHAVTEFSYGETTQISDINGNKYTKSAYKAIDNKTINKIKEFSVTYKSDLLKHVNVFDTPGWDPPSGTATSNDEQLTSKAIEKSDIVFFLIDINDGTIRDDTLKNRLKEIQKSDKKLYVILTRVDQCFDFDADEAENNPVKQNIMESLKLDKDKVMFYSSDNESREEQYVIDTRDKIGRIIFNAEKSKNNIALNKDKANEKELFVNEYCSFITNEILGVTLQCLDKKISKSNLYSESDFTNLESKTNVLIALLNNPS